MNKELEEAIKYLKLIRKNHDLEKKGYVYTEEAIETVLNYIDNSISKEIVENKLINLEKEYKEALEENSTKAFILKCQIEIAKELLEGK